MKQNSKNNNTNNYNTHYFPHEIAPVAVCAAYLGIVLKESPEAKELYNEIVGIL